MELVKNSKGTFAKLVNKLQSANKESVEVGWFSDQGTHHSGLSYPNLARVHLNGVRVPKRDILGMTLFLYPLKGDKKISNLVFSWAKNPSTREDALLRDLGNYERDNIKRTFGDPVLGVTSNPTPLVDTGEWKEATEVRVKRD